jgi:hypothetical protein
MSIVMAAVNTLGSKIPPARVPGASSQTWLAPLSPDDFGLEPKCLDPKWLEPKWLQNALSQNGLSQNGHKMP